jgi:restriction endonuclease Mrr
MALPIQDNLIIPILGLIINDSRGYITTQDAYKELAKIYSLKEEEFFELTSDKKEPKFHNDVRHAARKCRDRGYMISGEKQKKNMWEVTEFGKYHWHNMISSWRRLYRRGSGEAQMALFERIDTIKSQDVSEIIMQKDGISHSDLFFNKEEYDKNLYKKIVDMSFDYVNKIVRPDFLKEVKSLFNYENEEFVRDVMLCIENLHDVKTTQMTRDGGVDLTAKIKSGITEDNVIGQAKNNKKRLGPEEMRAFIGTMELEKCHVGIYFSTMGFSDESVKICKDYCKSTGKHIELLVTEDALKLFVEKDAFGIRKTINVPVVNNKYFNDIRKNNEGRGNKHGKIDAVGEVSEPEVIDLLKTD